MQCFSNRAESGKAIPESSDQYLYPTHELIITKKWSPEKNRNVRHVHIIIIQIFVKLLRGPRSCKDSRNGEMKITYPRVGWFNCVATYSPSKLYFVPIVEGNSIWDVVWPNNSEIIFPLVTRRYQGLGLHELNDLTLSSTNLHSMPQASFWTIES